MSWAPAALSAGKSIYDMASDDDEPATPDYSAAAKEQGKQARATAELEANLNRTDINSPYGSVNWEAQTQENPEWKTYYDSWKDQGGLIINGEARQLTEDQFNQYMRQLGVSPTVTTGYTQNITLSPEQQAIYNAQTQTALGRQQLAQSMLPQAQLALGRSINYGDLPSAGEGLTARSLQESIDLSGLQNIGDVTDIRNKAEQAVYQRLTSRLDPRWQEQESSLRTRLYNQGLREGDEAFDREMQRFQTAKTDAYQTAMNEAISGGGEEATRQYGMQLGARQQGVSERTAQANFVNAAMAQGLSQDQAISAYQNVLRQQALSEEQGKRVQAINEMNALQSGQQVSVPNIQSASPVNIGQGGDLTQAANLQYQAGINQYNLDQAKLQQMLQGISGLTPYLFGNSGSSTNTGA